MSDAKDVTFSLKVMINREKTKVLFAEADSNFVDVLLSFLTLPLGRTVRVLEKHYGDKAPTMGSLTTLYKGLANLDIVHFWTDGGKKMLLNPRSSSAAECRKLKLNVDDSEPIKILPNSTGFMHTLSNIGITDMDGAELRNVCFGFNEIMDLLKGSLLSPTPLSDIILNDRCSAAAKPDFRALLIRPFADYALSKSDSKKVILKVMVQKSTNKFLFAQAEEDFVDFLFSLLNIPLGGVARLLQGNISLTNIDNLYKSVAHFIDDKYLRSPDSKNRLIKPKLPHLYLSNNQILPLVEETLPVLYYHHDNEEQYLSPSRNPRGKLVPSFKPPRGHENFVKGPTTYVVTDDLVVTQFCMASSFSIINRLNISMSDVKQLDLHIGLQEGLCILKASLTTDSALSNALINHMPKKEQKQGN